METKKRYGLIDTMRGLCLISMILYHTFYDLVFIYCVRFPFYHETAAYIWQQSICWTFILLAGFSFSFGRHHLKRGMILLACGFVIELVTAFAIPDEIVRFGILTFMGFATLLMIPLEKLLAGVPTFIGLPASMLMFILFRNVNDGFLGFEGLQFVRLPDFLYSTPLSTVIGFTQSSFSSSDYFALLPWFFLYLTGYFLWKLWDAKKEHIPFLYKEIPGVSFIGRHTLPIYMLHQPVVMGVLILVHAAGLI